MSQGTHRIVSVAELNGLPAEQLFPLLESCCASNRWVEAMIAARPFEHEQHLLDLAGQIAGDLSRDDWLEAFAHHPRIGDVESLRRRFGARSGGWSEGEQAGASGASEQVLADLAEANRRYEQRFGYLFIVCATGKSAEQMLELLRSRLDNPPDLELQVAAGQQLEITRLRLGKLLRG